MAFAAFNRKRINQLSQLTRRRNIIESLELDHVTIAILEVNLEELKKIQMAHEKIVDEMLGQEDCDDEKEARLNEDILRFQDSYDAAMSHLIALKTQNVTVNNSQINGEPLNESMPTIHQSPVMTTQHYMFQIKMLINKLNNMMKVIQEEPSNYALEHLQSMLHKTDQIVQQIEVNFAHIVSATDEDEQMDLMELQKSVQDDHLKLCTWFYNEIKSKTVEPGATSSKTHEPYTKIKLPSIELPKFDGTPSSWITFRDLFISMIHDNKQLHRTQKFRYLKTSIVDKMSPVAHLNETDDGYLSAWESVLKFYDDKRKIVDTHIVAILSLKKMTAETHEELQKLLSQVNVHTDALDRLVKPEDWKEVVLANIVNHRLDATTRNLFETDNKDEIPHWSKMKSFLEKRRKTLNAMPAIKKTVVQAPANTSKLSWGSKTSNVVSNSNTSSNKGKCMMCCSSDHKLAQCSQYLSLSPSQRIVKVKEFKMCTNCLGFHRYDQCTAQSSCKNCQRKHHTTLHNNSLVDPKKQALLSQLKNLQDSDINSSLNPDVEAFTVNSACNATRTVRDSLVFLSTAIVKIRGHDDQWHDARALLDSGSDANFITANIANVLKLQKFETKIEAKGFGETPNLITSEVHARISAREGFYNKNLQFLVTNKITGMTPSTKINLQQIQVPNNITLADPTFHVPGQIDILIGNELYLELLLNGRIHVPGGPIFQETVFGYIVAGKIKHSHRITTQSCNLISHSELRTSIEKFYKDEDYRTPTRFLTDEEIHCETHFEQTHRRSAEGRFIVQIPLKENVDQLVNNRGQAICQLIANEKRLMKNERLRQESIKFMREYESLGHMQEIEPPNETDSPVYYLPHHAVEKPESTTTKVRIVFNASSKTKSGLSLNDVQCVGPTVQSDSFTLNLKFRQYPVVIKADIAKMYRQIEIVPEQQNLQLIVWREDMQHRIKTYKLKTVTYGTASASFLSTRCLKQLAIDSKDQYPEASNEILNGFYVDDLISGAATPQKAIQLFKSIDKIVASGAMKLRKISSNSEEFLESIPEDDKEASASPDMTFKALGIKWNPSEDTIEFDVKPIDLTKVSKRSILSEIAKIYDPQGLLGPVVFKLKQFMTKIHQLKTAWDAQLPEVEAKEWINLARSFIDLQNIRIQRHITLSIYISVQLHGFSDASEQGYGAAVYIRSEDSNGNRASHLICAKSRVSPMAKKSIARLELCGGVILIHLITQVSKALNINFNKTVCWMDSAIALHWIKKPPNSLQTYVANRVSEIQEMSENITWCHVRGEENPADLISRGLFPDEIINNTMWWNGPEFLMRPEEKWPISILTLSPDEPLYKSEFKKITPVNVHVIQQDENPFTKIVNDSSRTFTSNGITRVATVKTINSTFERPVNKLALLPIDDNE